MNSLAEQPFLERGFFRNSFLADAFSLVFEKVFKESEILGRFI
jgi:hypothetical protein